MAFLSNTAVAPDVDFVFDRLSEKPRHELHIGDSSRATEDEAVGCASPSCRQGASGPASGMRVRLPLRYLDGLLLPVIEVFACSYRVL